MIFQNLFIKVVNVVVYVSYNIPFPSLFTQFRPRLVNKFSARNNYFSSSRLAMRQLENVGETLVSSYFSNKEVLSEKFGSDLSSENPYWEERGPKCVSSLSDICIKVRSQLAVSHQICAFNAVLDQI